jgi:hypothetical protein
MADRAPKSDRIWLSIATYCTEAIRIVDIVQMMDEKSETMPIAISAVVDGLRQEILIITAISTDNALNEMEMRSIIRDDSVQSSTQVLRFQILCRAHTIHLAIHGFLTALREFPA